MKSKILNLTLLITSLFGYLEWGGNNSSFLFEAEIDVLSKLITDPVSAFHPFTLLPLAGQLLLFITLFQKEPGRLLTFTGLSGIGLLLTFMFVAALISFSPVTLLSTLPFLITSVLVIRHYRKESPDE